jgi:hypothetical protein
MVACMFVVGLCCIVVWFVTGWVRALKYSSWMLYTSWFIFYYKEKKWLVFWFKIVTGSG